MRKVTNGDRLNEYGRFFSAPGSLSVIFSRSNAQIALRTLLGLPFWRTVNWAGGSSILSIH